jgi:hypothetical protein
MNVFPEKEDARTEFKARDFLQKDAAEVVRPIVAFLNGRGGTLWIGVRDSVGKIALEDIATAEAERIRLRDRIIDAIEPTPSDTEASVDVHVERGHKLLRVEVSKGRDPPYAARHGSLGREYLIRTDDRNRLMTREELRAMFAGHKARSSDNVEEALLRELNKFAAGLHVVLAPEAAKFDLTKKPIREALEAILRSPESAKNRPMGWTFHNPYEQLRPAPRDGLVFGRGEEDGHSVVIRSNGFVGFTAPLGRLIWSGTHGPDPLRSLHPLPLIELPISAMRIAARLYETLGVGSDQLLYAGLALVGVVGWTLVPHSPQSIGHQLEKPHAAPDEAIVRATTSRVETLLQRPDSIGITLLSGVYWDFGLTTDQLPREIDQQAAVLRLG